MREGAITHLLHEQAQDHFNDKLQKLREAFFTRGTRSGLLAYLPIVLVIIAMFFGTAWLVFSPFSDPARYQCYALTFWLGSHATHLLPPHQCDFLLESRFHISFPQPQFHMLPIEYPPLALALFSPALLVPLAYYQFAFALLMSLVALFVYWLLLRYGPQRAALIFALYLFIGALATTHNRFDLAPAALTLICVIAAERKHWTAAYIALAFGVLLKLYPLLLLPALFIAEQRSLGRLHLPGQRSTPRDLLPALLQALRGFTRWRWTNSLVALGVVAAVTAGFALLNPQNAVLSQLDYFVSRPIQVEATGSTLLWLARSIAPIDARLDFGSYNIVSALADPVSRLCTLGLLLGIIYVLYLQWRGRLDLTQAFIALLLVSIATGKVFSPQYLIWLIPLLAYAGAFDARWLLLWGTTSLLTTFAYAFFYTRAMSDINMLINTPGFFETVGLRNAFFVLITLSYLFNWFQLRQRRSLPLSAIEQHNETTSYASPSTQVR